jgi:hypothetical protein
MALESYYLKVVQQTCPSTGRCAYRWTMFRWADRAGSSKVGTAARRVRKLLLIWL